MTTTTSWYLLASGLTGGANGKIYRVHTTSTDPANVAHQQRRDGENSFALYARADWVGTPRIYGIGAMQAFTPLVGRRTVRPSEFYLAQIDAVHAGKTVEIKLWDPGDTNPLSGLAPDPRPEFRRLVDRRPSTTRRRRGRRTARCRELQLPQPETTSSSVQTNVGATPGTFNGCWLTIQVPIPGGYTAEQDGWWKIRYTMTEHGTSNDVTTWKVAIKGNPVHLIVP